MKNEVKEIYNRQTVEVFPVGILSGHLGICEIMVSLCFLFVL